MPPSDHLKHGGDRLAWNLYVLLRGLADGDDRKKSLVRGDAEDVPDLRDVAYAHDQRIPAVVLRRKDEV